MRVNSRATPLGLLIVLVLSLDCSQAIQPTPPLASPSASPTTQTRRPPTLTAEPSTPSPEAALRLDRLTWRTFTEPFSGPNHNVSGLFINGRSELVAWGYWQRNSPFETGTAFWTTNDGLAWREDLLRDPDDGLHVVDVAGGAAGFVAVGYGDMSSAAWWSRDGASWSPSTITPLPVTEEEAFKAVAAGPDGFLAVGVVGEAASRAAAWFSPTGEAWTRVNVDLPRGAFEDVAVRPDGGFLVVGYDGSDGGLHGSASTVSSDGQNWVHATDSSALSGDGSDVLSQVWSFAAGYMALGQHAAPGEDIYCKGCYWDPELWRTYTSSDGVDWRRNDPRDGTGLVPMPPWYGAVEPWEDGLIAVGRASDQTRRVWVSEDGVEWTPIGESVVLTDPSGSSADVFDVLVSENYLVLGGLASEGGFVTIGTSP